MPYTPAIVELMKPWVNRSLQCDDGTTFADVKQGSKECGFDSHRDLQISSPWNHVAVRAKATPEKAEP